MSQLDLHEALVPPITYENLVLMAKNLNPEHGRTLRDEFITLLNVNCAEAIEMFDEHESEIYEAAFPQPVELVNHADWDEARVEALAKDVYEWLKDHGMWVDICMYFNGKRWSTESKENGKSVFRYNGEPFVDEADPRDYFEYVANPHILSMSFEGELYEVLNACRPGWVKLENEFQKIFQKHGCYFELGHAWNLTCYV